MKLRLKPEDRPRTVWLLALLVFMFGCRTIVSRESGIAKASAAIDELTRRIAANDRVLAQAATLRRREQLAWADLRKISGGQQPAVSVAEFLRRLGELASRLQLSVVSVTPSSVNPDSRIGSTALVPLSMIVLVRGKFRSLMTFIQEATRQRALTGLESAQLMVSPVPSEHGAGLDATIHVTLYRLLLHAAAVPAN